MKIARHYPINVLLGFYIARTLKAFVRKSLLSNDLRLLEFQVYFLVSTALAVGGVSGRTSLRVIPGYITLRFGLLLNL